jgi:Uma2 family endonuclease
MLLSEIQLINKDEEMSRFNHANAITYLILRLASFVEEHDLGEVMDDFDIQLTVTNKRVRPDLVYISHPNLVHLIDGIYHGAPDLVAEVVSPASYIEDNEGKKLLYAAEGIPEYWLIFPEAKIITVYGLHNGVYVPHAFAIEKGVVTSQVLPGFELEVSKIFKGVRIG